MIVRRAREEDIDRILLLTDMVADKHGQARGDILREHPYHIQKAKLCRDIASPHHIPLAAEEDGEIIGIVLCSCRRYEGDPKYRDGEVMSIEDTCVHPEYRGRGVGSALLTAAAAAARERGCCRMESNVWAFNEESLAFFRGNGFSIQKMTMECAIHE